MSFVQAHRLDLAHGVSSMLAIVAGNQVNNDSKVKSPLTWRGSSKNKVKRMAMNQSTEKCSVKAASKMSVLLYYLFLLCMFDIAHY